MTISKILKKSYIILITWIKFNYISYFFFPFLVKKKVLSLLFQASESQYLRKSRTIPCWKCFERNIQWNLLCNLSSNLTACFSLWINKFSLWARACLSSKTIKIEPGTVSFQDFIPSVQVDFFIKNSKAYFELIFFIVKS